MGEGWPEVVGEGRRTLRAAGHPLSSWRKEAAPYSVWLLLQLLPSQCSEINI